MKWYDKESVKKLMPKLGDKRYKEGFLWKIKRLDKQYRWLERARWEEMYQLHEGDNGDIHSCWKETHWADKEPWNKPVRTPVDD